MNIAVIISGEYRTFEQCVKTHDHMLAGNDIFVSTWSESNNVNMEDTSLSIQITGIDEAQIRKTLEGYNVISTCIEHYDPDFWRSDVMRYNSAMLHRWEKGLELVEATGKRYDVIVIMRPDLFFGGTCTTPRWEIFNVEGLLQSAWSSDTTLNDILMIGTPSTIKNTLMKVEEWNAAEDDNWHTKFFTHVSSKGITVRNLHHTSSLIIGRPPLEFLTDFPSALKNFYKWQNCVIEYQRKEISFQFILDIWGRERIVKLYPELLAEHDTVTTPRLLPQGSEL